MNFDTSRDSLIDLLRDDIAGRLEVVKRQIEAEYHEAIRRAMALAFADVFAWRGSEPFADAPAAQENAELATPAV